MLVAVRVQHVGIIHARQDDGSVEINFGLAPLHTRPSRCIRVLNFQSLEDMLHLPPE